MESVVFFFSVEGWSLKVEVAVEATKTKETLPISTPPNLNTNLYGVGLIPFVTQLMISQTMCGGGHKIHLSTQWRLPSCWVVSFSVLEGLIWHLYLSRLRSLMTLPSCWVVSFTVLEGLIWHLYIISRLRSCSYIWFAGKRSIVSHGRYLFFRSIVSHGRYLFFRSIVSHGRYLFFNK